jgi:hypothetical protein
MGAVESEEAVTPCFVDYLESLLQEGNCNHKPEPYYLADGDSLVIHFKPDMAYASRVDDVVTVYKSEETNELVGCKLKGVSQLVNNIVSLVKIDDHPVRLTFLLASAAGTKPPKEYYYELSEAMGEISIDPQLLKAA